MSCPNCERSFSSNQSLQYHLDHQVCNRRQCPHCHTKFTRAASLQYHLDHQVCQGDSPITKKTAKKIVAHGQEDMERVLRDYPRLWEEARSHEHLAIPYVVETIFCNRRYPEYRNVYFPKRRDVFVRVYDGEQWTYQTEKRFRERLHRRFYELLQPDYDEGQYEDSELEEKWERIRQLMGGQIMGGQIRPH